MSEQTAAKVTGAHLARTAYLYVRQSTLRQVLTNTESAARQYALRQKAIALGWQAEAIVTIDTDQGQSGASAADREGFQHLVAEVSMGRAGIVLGLEVSRLARNNAELRNSDRRVQNVEVVQSSANRLDRAPRSRTPKSEGGDRVLPDRVFRGRGPDGQ